MIYSSTRGGEKNVDFTSVLLNGLAKDGGLYVPDYFPNFSRKQLEGLRNLNYSELCFEVTKQFISERDIPHKEYKKICLKTYSQDFEKKIIEIDKLNNFEYLLNLFHGPTFAFKDYALQLLGNIYDFILKKKKINLTILGATSGDTGSAAIYGCSKSKNIKTFILYPDQKVSEIQRKQMTTFESNKVFCVAINGNFDDCQKLVKDFFNSKDRKNLNLAAVNSINWVRIMGQIVYYFWSYFRVNKEFKELNYVVPTGNFGNVYAGYVSKKMGLPINKLIVSSNSNDILTRFFESGTMEVKHAIKTLSPSMDIQISSNFERLLYNEIKNTDYINGFYDDLNKKGKFKIDRSLLQRLRKVFGYGRLNDDETAQSIKLISENFGIILDPHTAVGLSIGRKVLADNEKRVYLATAHYSKFIDTVNAVLSRNLSIPNKLSKVLNRKEKFKKLENDLDELKKYVIQKSRLT